MSWNLLNEVNQNNTRDFSVYRCPDPVAVTTGSPWYNIENLCPCDPNLSNTSGQGYSGCPFGINEAPPPSLNVSNSQLASQIPQKQMTGAMYSMNQFVPIQLNPYPNTRIGQSWRNPG